MELWKVCFLSNPPDFNIQCQMKGKKIKLFSIQQRSPPILIAQCGNLMPWCSCYCCVVLLEFSFFFFLCYFPFSVSIMLWIVDHCLQRIESVWHWFYYYYLLIEWIFELNVKIGKLTTSRTCISVNIFHKK